MTRVSGNSGRQQLFVEKSDDLPAIFTKELGDVLSVVASRVRLTVRFRSGATPIECIGRDGRIADSTVTVDLNQLYGGQEKYLLVRVELAPGRDGESRLLADAEVTFEDATRRRPDAGRRSPLSRHAAAADVLQPPHNGRPVSAGP